MGVIIYVVIGVILSAAILFGGIVSCGFGGCNTLESLLPLGIIAVIWVLVVFRIRRIRKEHKL